MPLYSGKKAKTKKGFEHNFKEEIKAGKPKKQALAIAYSEKKEKGKKRKEGREKKRSMEY